MKVLVIGSTGQLGYAITQKLSQSDYAVVALHRSTSHTEALQKLPGVDLVEGDLLDPNSLDRALKGVDIVLSTANAAIPTRREDTFQNDLVGHQNLIRSCQKAGVKQIIFTSAIPFGPFDRSVPLSRSKRRIEEGLKASGIPYTIFQPTNFMDIYFAFFGTELPLEGTTVASLARPFKFMNDFYNGVRKSMKENGEFGIVGKGDRKSAFICIEDVADFHVNAIAHPKAMNLITTIGGPEALSSLEVKALFEEAYGKTLKVKTTPAMVLGLMSKVMPLFNPNAANILAMQYVGTKVDCLVPHALEVADTFGVQLKDARTFILEKAGMVEETV